MRRWKRGSLDRLPNSGQPIDLEWYFAMAPHLRLGYSLLRSNDCAPQEVELLKEIEEMERTLAAKTDQHERQALRASDPRPAPARQFDDRAAAAAAVRQP